MTVVSTDKPMRRGPHMESRGTLQRNEAIMTCLVLGGSIRQVARNYGLAPSTVCRIKKRMMAIAERDGILAQLKLERDGLPEDLAA